MLVMSECPLPAGMPDLVVVVADRDLLRARARCGIAPILAAGEIKLVAACAVNRATSFEFLEENAGVSSSHLRRTISSLVRRGALIPTGRGWRRAPQLMPFGRTYALEAKVADWRAGLWQAMRYASYADASALVMEAASTKTLSEIRAVARAQGVGVFVDGKWRLRPRITRHLLQRRLLTSEQVLAALGEEIVSV
jgi:hypothetical protein